MKYIDAEKLIAYLNKVKESYKSKMVDPTKFPIDHIDLMALLAREYQALIENITSLQQEQPSEDLEKAAEEYMKKARKHLFDDSPIGTAKDAFKAGANWQKEQMTGLSIHDLELLHTFLYAVKNNKHGAFTFTRLSDEQYEEVLRRFNKAKEDTLKRIARHFIEIGKHIKED